MTGFNTIALASVGVATVGSAAGYALVRSRDFVSVGGWRRRKMAPELMPFMA